MGAQIILCDPHRAVVIGHDHRFRLKAGNLLSPDIRAGIALLLAAIRALAPPISLSLHTAPLVRYFARWAQYAHVGPHPQPVGHPLSINGEGEWTSGCGRCDKFGEGEGINPVRGFRIPFGNGE